jgi:pyruvate dehydrogenase kinase 2/3/4
LWVGVGAGQHIELHKKTLPDGYIGLIHSQCSPVEVAEMAIEDARATCMRTYGGAPEVKVYGDRNFTFAYVRAPPLTSQTSVVRGG